MIEVMRYILFFILFPFYLSAQSKGGAMVVSEDFVKGVLNYPSSASFPALSKTVESNGYGKYIILGVVKAKNAFGVQSEMIYKIWLEYKSGDEVLKSSWICSKLILEEKGSEKQHIFYPSNGKVQKSNSTSVAEIEFLGSKCKIIEQSSLFIRILTPKKYTESEIKKGVDSFQYKNKIIYFHTKGKTKRGEEYAQMQNGKNLFYF